MLRHALRPPYTGRVGRVVTLATGAEARMTNGGGGRAVVLVNGGQRREVAGTWSTTLEFLVGRLAPAFPSLGFVEVRYRVKSWRRLDSCIEDTRAAVEAGGGRRTLLLGFSMGGAVAIASSAEPGVEGVLGLAPWIPDRLDLGPLRGKRLDVVHGSLDRALPGIPGVSPESSRRGFERAREAGIVGSYTLLRGGLHGIALRAGGLMLPLPRAGAWLDAVAARLERFAA